MSKKSAFATTRREVVAAGVAASMGTLLMTRGGFARANDADYSFLDGMSVEELESLKNEVQSRIDKMEADSQDSDSETYGKWEVRHYVDKFKRETDMKFISYADPIIGEFSNSATTGSDLLVSLCVDPNGMVRVVLAEYESNVVKGVFDINDYEGVLLDKDGNEKKLTGSMEQDSPNLWFTKDSSALVTASLSAGGPVSFYIEEKSDYSSSDYLFTIEDTDGFDEAFAAIQNDAGSSAEDEK